MSVSFTEENEQVMTEKGYFVEESELGKVYYPGEGVCIVDEIIVKYMEYPWITCFEVDGIKIV